MSFDLAVWRRSPTTKTAMVFEVYESLGFSDHPAAAMFDAHDFVEQAAAVAGRLPESDAEMTWIPIPLPSGDIVAV